MITGKTKSGFKFSIDERIKDDWRVLSAIADCESADESKKIVGLSSLVDIILGNQKVEFLDHIAKKNDGFVPSSAVMDDVTSILNAMNELKN